MFGITSSPRCSTGELRKLLGREVPLPPFRRPPSPATWAAMLGLAGTAGGSSCCSYGGPLLRYGKGRSRSKINLGSHRRAGRCTAANCSGSNESSQRGDEGSWVSSDAASPYQILGVDPSCSPAQLKSAFRARVKEFHPDVCKDIKYSDAIIRRVIQAYEMLSKYHKSEATERESLDPFEEPECEAADVFVNEILCVGKACPYSCVKMAPHAFSFSSYTGTACAVSQGHTEDYKVHLAVGQCPRRCIHYVTPSQRAILEEVLHSILNAPYDAAEAAVLDSLIAKAKFENNRYRKPKKQPKVSTEYVDWF